MHGNASCSIKDEMHTQQNTQMCVLFPLQPMFLCVMSACMFLALTRQQQACYTATALWAARCTRFHCNEWGTISLGTALAEHTRYPGC